MANAAIRIAVLADAANATRSLGGLGKTIVGFAAGLGALDVLKDAVNGASDLSEAASKVNVVFGKQAPIIAKAAKTAATSMGLSEAAYLSATGTLGNLLVSLDLAPSKAASMSQEMVKLAGDLASFNNVSPEEALEALKSGLTGEAEPLKRFGVNMNDATLTAQALKLGLIKTTKEALTPQQKALSAHALIMAQTKTAQGDFARTSGGLANQQRILAAKFEDVKAKVGAVFLPIITKAVVLLNDRVIPAFIKAGPRIAELGNVVRERVVPVLKDFGRFLTGTVVPALAKLGKFVKDNGDFFKPFVATILAIVAALRVWAAVQAVLNAVMSANPLGLLIIAIAAVVAGVIYAYKHSSRFREILDTTWDVIKKVASALASAAKAVAGFISELGKGISGAFTATVKFFKDLPGNITDALGSLGKTLYNKGRELLVGFQKGVISFARAVDDYFGGLPGMIVRFIGNVNRTLYSIGRTIIVGFARGYVSYMTTLARAVGGLAGSVLRWVGNVAYTLAQKGRQIIVGFAQGYASYMVTLARTVGGLAGSVLRWVGSVVSTLWTKGRQIIVGFAQGYASYIGAVADFFAKMPSNIVRWIGNLASTLWYAGRAVIQGLIDGIGSKLRDLGNYLGGVGKFIQEHKGPLPKDRKLLTPAGQALILGLIRGMDSETGRLKRFLGGISADIENGITASPRVALSASVAPGNGAASASAPVINVYALTSGPEVGRQVVQAITDYERTNGARWRS